MTANDASSTERDGAYAVTNIIKAKAKLGMGINNKKDGQIRAVKSITKRKSFSRIVHEKQTKRKTKRPHKVESGIFNLDSSSRGEVIHWTAYILGGHYDPFGFPPPTELMRYLKPSRLFYTKRQDTKLRSKN